MGCDPSDRGDQRSSVSNRIELPNKLFEDCDGVDSISVPRKLRSAMQKRSHESLSSPLKETDGVKKSKLNRRRGALSRNEEPHLITKEEEEVVETLYALAGMFPVPAENADHENKLKSESSQTRVSPKEASSQDSPILPSEVTKGSLSTIWPPRSPGVVNSSSIREEFAKKVEQVTALMEPSAEEYPEFLQSQRPTTELNSSDVHRLCAVESEENDDEKSFLERGMRLSLQSEISPCERKSDFHPGEAMDAGDQFEGKYEMKESKRNGPVLCPALSPPPMHDAQRHDPLPASASKFPPWLGAATGTAEVSGGKVSAVNLHYAGKRCAAHVYISHLIRILRVQDTKNCSQLQLSQLRPPEASKQWIQTAVDNTKGGRTSLEDVAPEFLVCNSSTGKRRTAGTAGGPQLRCLNQEPPEAGPASALYKAQMQGFDFLSLSAGSGGVETHRSLYNKASNTSKSLARPQVPGQALTNQYAIPFTLAQPRHFCAFPDQPSVVASQQVQQQKLSGNGRSFYGLPHPSSSSPFMNLQQQQLPHQQLIHQQQQRLWAARFAPQYELLETNVASPDFHAGVMGGRSHL